MRLVAQLFFLWPFIRMGLTDIVRHKTRSFLTMLGMVFGVGSVIAMLAVGEGASEQTLEGIRRLGCNNIILDSVSPPAEDGKGTGSSSARLNLYGLLWDDLLRIRESIPGVNLLVPARMTRREARLRESSCQIRVVETTPDWFVVVPRELVAGRLLNRRDLDKSSSACVLTENGARRLLAGREGIGERVRIGSTIFQVVGVVASEKAEGGQSLDAEADAYIPITTGRRVFGETVMRFVGGGRSTEGEKVELNQIIVRLGGMRQVEPAAKAIEAMLRHFHRKPDYAMNVPLVLLKESERTKRMYNIVLGTIAGISLLVGGIGIMNIMLASVTERTREIGIRRAIGARRSRIVIQFLINTCVISITGGALGVIVGLTIPLAVTAFSGMPAIVRPYSLFLAFGISVATGVIFGLYPALRASRLDPIEALRHE